MSNYDKSGPLDSAIDEAVRELMQIDPRPGLRHRVGASIRSQSEQERRRFGAGFAWAAAVAVVVLATVFLLRSPEPSRPEVAPQVVAGPPVAPAVAPPAPASAESPIQTPPTKARRSAPSPESIFGPRTTRVAATSVPLVDLPPRGTGDPLDEPFLVPGAVPAIAPISIAPLWIAPLTIDPLTLGSLPVRR